MGILFTTDLKNTIMKLQVGDRYVTYGSNTVYTVIADQYEGMVWKTTNGVYYMNSDEKEGNILWGRRINNFKAYYNAYKGSDREQVEKSQG